MKNTKKNEPKPYKSGRLNLRFLRRLSWVMLLGDVVLALLLYGWALIDAERDVRELLDSRPAMEDMSGEPLALEISVYIAARPYGLSGLSLPDFMQRWMPLNTEGVVRRMTFAPRNAGVGAWLRSGVYHLWLPGDSLEVTCDVGPRLEGLWRVLCVLTCFQLFWLLMSIAKGARAIRRTLRPLYAMINQANSLSMRNAPVRADAMAGELYDIDGRRLHRRLSVGDVPEELKPLAAAINDMLDRIEAAYEAQARFVSDASHELRTPIAIIQGYVNLLDRWGKTDEATLQESLEALKSEARGMGEMVEQLLFLARGDSDAIEMTLEKVDLGALCQEVARDMTVAHPDCAVTVKSGQRSVASGRGTGETEENDQEKSVFAYADRTLCRQALRILLDNAVKYGEGKPVTMAVGADAPGWVCASVSDSGQGITPEDMSRIFDRFFRSDTSRAHKTGGAGLGLSIARWIAVKHGGQLTALSRPGIGTRMTIRLPGAGG